MFKHYHTYTKNKYLKYVCMYINVIFTYGVPERLHMLTVGQKTLWTANKHMHLHQIILKHGNMKRFQFLLYIFIKFFCFLIKLFTNQLMSK